jgi:hypothetical protein
MISKTSDHFRQPCETRKVPEDMLGHRAPKKRRFLALGIALLLISLSGCVGLGPENGPYSCHYRRRIAPVWYGYVDTHWQPWPNTADRTCDSPAAPAGQPQEPTPPANPFIKEALPPEIVPSPPGSALGTPKEAPFLLFVPAPPGSPLETPKKSPSPESTPAPRGGASGAPTKVSPPESAPVPRGGTSGASTKVSPPEIAPVPRGGASGASTKVSPPEIAPVPRGGASGASTKVSPPEIAPVPRGGASGAPASTTPATENTPTSENLSPAEPAGKPASTWVPHWS